MHIGAARGDSELSPLRTELEDALTLVTTVREPDALAVSELVWLRPLPCYDATRRP